MHFSTSWCRKDGAGVYQNMFSYKNITCAVPLYTRCTLCAAIISEPHLSIVPSHQFSLVVVVNSVLYTRSLDEFHLQCKCLIFINLQALSIQLHVCGKTRNPLGHTKCLYLAYELQHIVESAKIEDTFHILNKYMNQVITNP